MAHLIISALPPPVYLINQFKIKNEKLKNVLASRSLNYPTIQPPNYSTI